MMNQPTMGISALHSIVCALHACILACVCACACVRACVRACVCVCVYAYKCVLNAGFKYGKLESKAHLP